MEDFKIAKEEYLEFLQFKKESIIKKAHDEALQLDEKIAKLFSEPQINGKKHRPKAESAPVIRKAKNNTRGSIGWKFIIDEVLKKTENALSQTEISNAVVNNPETPVSPAIAQKSVGSALRFNANKGRYLIRKIKGVKHYTFNKDFVEQ
jgi:hypothetical protein